MPTVNYLKKLYEIDDSQWLEETMKLLKNREFDQLDLDNLIEELAELGREKKNAVVSLLEQVIRYFLMYEYWTTELERNANHWEAEIYNFKLQLNRLLTSNLKIYLAQNMDKIYQSSRKYVQKKTSLTNLPDNNPYSLEQLLDEEYLPKK